MFDFNLDKFEFDVKCPRCQFIVKILYRDARLREVLICRGCKSNIQLDDSMNECRKARRQVNEAMAALNSEFSKLNSILSKL